MKSETNSDEGVWVLEDAVALCKVVEEAVVPVGYHVALTGGCLYKEGARKDCDLILYSVRQSPTCVPGVVSVLSAVGFSAPLPEVVYKQGEGEPWVVKATYKGKPVDLLFPESPKNKDE